MYIIFYNTNDVFSAEELISKLNLNVEVVPTPVQDKAYCGVCIKTDKDKINICQIITIQEMEKI